MRDNDPINELNDIDSINPPYYRAGGIQVIDIIREFDLGFCMGNAIKYILRSGKKGDELEDAQQDLRKALWYIQEELKNPSNE